ncbi:kinesin-like protein KIF12 [Babylonia areolata]|uniref:kinesin-like protein KIF12 n=1 Tax=Babylonia areolata TaxID=304850 RepID=UPI003FD5D84C
MSGSVNGHNNNNTNNDNNIDNNNNSNSEVMPGSRAPTFTRAPPPQPRRRSVMSNNGGGGGGGGGGGRDISRLSSYHEPPRPPTHGHGSSHTPGAATPFWSPTPTSSSSSRMRTVGYSALARRERRRSSVLLHSDGTGCVGSTTTLSSANETTDENGDGHFNVVLRVRPLSGQEKQRRDRFAVSFPGEGQCEVLDSSSGSQRGFQFNVVFEPDSAQEDVFENSGIRKLVDNAVSGYTCTAFAFGQTGSGKTHTMTGPPAQFHQEGARPDPKMYGLIQRSFKHLYRQIKEQGGGKIVRASYLEIYNEQVIDLLNHSHRRYLSVRWSKNKGFYVENLFTVECEKLDDLMAVLEEGLRNRQTGSHGLNEFSSRSHSVLTVTIESETQADTEDDSVFVTKRGKLSFVDLAGSEKVKDANSSGLGGPGILESNSINKSLLVLGNCISHLGDAKRRHGHIPYRDSKLTKLLSDSLGGNGITLMIACITPSSANITETMNTLRYASRAKKIKSSKPTVKMDPREKLIMNLKREIKVLRSENHYLRQQLDFPAKPKGQLQKENDEKFMKFMKEQKEKETGLYEMLQEYMVENENLRAENSEMHSTRDRTRREQQLLYRENEKLMKRVDELERVVAQNPAAWSRGQGQGQRTDGYGHRDLGSPLNHVTGSPGFFSGHRHSVGSPPGSRGKGDHHHSGISRPPHHLPPDRLGAVQRPAHLVENGHLYAAASNGYSSPVRGPPSPTRVGDRRGSQTSTTEAIHSMNEQLKREVMQLEGMIQQHRASPSAASHSPLHLPHHYRDNGHSIT